MAVYVERRQVEWGDCDAAGIVFYPSYFRWMDAAFHRFTQALGFDQRTLAAEGLLGTPLVDASCRFVSPVRYYDPLDIAVRPVRLGRSSLAMAYDFRVGGRQVAEGAETRAFVAETEGGLGARAMPEAVRAALAARLAD
jgi:YbgC/YbaW family acyl-CoA thioester hydrolase